MIFGSVSAVISDIGLTVSELLTLEARWNLIDDDA